MIEVDEMSLLGRREEREIRNRWLELCGVGSAEMDPSVCGVVGGKRTLEAGGEREGARSVEPDRPMMENAPDPRSADGVGDKHAAPGPGAGKL